MPADPAPSAPRYRKPAVIALAALFLAVWGSAMTAGLTFRPCTDRPPSDPGKITYCNISIISGALIDMFPSERAKRSPLLLERGIARAAAGDSAGAGQDFRRALLDAARADGKKGIAFPQDLKRPQIARLFAAMQRQTPDSVANVEWSDAVRDVSCRNPLTVAPELCPVP